jgi:hypothetical protein
MTEITGNRYHRLTAIEFVEFRFCTGEKRSKKEYWRFKCECGKTKVLNKHAVMQGHTKSCGCLRLYFMKKQSYKNYRNNLTNAKTSRKVPELVESME